MYVVIPLLYVALFFIYCRKSDHLLYVAFYMGCTKSHQLLYVALMIWVVCIWGQGADKGVFIIRGQGDGVVRSHFYFAVRGALGCT